MPLIKCSKCGFEVSDRAEICPRCDYPVALSMKRMGTTRKPVVELRRPAAEPDWDDEPGWDEMPAEDLFPDDEPVNEPIPEDEPDGADEPAFRGDEPDEPIPGEAHEEEQPPQPKRTRLRVGRKQSRAEDLPRAEDLTLDEEPEAPAEEPFPAAPLAEDEREQLRAEMRRRSRRKTIIAIAVACALLAAAFAAAWFFSREFRTYQAGVLSYVRGDYESALSHFSAIPDYRDAGSLAEKSRHSLDIANDDTAPVITGIAEGGVIEVEYGSQFNLRDYLASNLFVTDAVSGDLSDYTISTSSGIYDSESGSLRTGEGGQFPFAVSAEDEAGNRAVCNFSVHIDETIRITAAEQLPFVLYDGEYGKVTLNSVVHDAPNDMDTNMEYRLEYTLENRSDQELDVWFGQCYLNGEKVDVYTSLRQSVAAAETGDGHSTIYDTDLSEAMEDFPSMELMFRIGHNAYGDPEILFTRPVQILREAIAFQEPPAEEAPLW